MERWLCLILLTVFSLALPDSPSRAADTKRPNILCLIAKDMSPDLDCYGTEKEPIRQRSRFRRSIPTIPSRARPGRSTSIPRANSATTTTRAYLVWSLIPELGKKGELTDRQKAFYLAPRMPPEELYDMDADEWSMHNLAGSDEPEHQAVLKRLRGVLQKWIEKTKDQGSTLEPEELAKNLGRTKPGTKPLSTYQVEEAPAKSKRQ